MPVVALDDAKPEIQHHIETIPFLDAGPIVRTATAGKEPDSAAQIVDLLRPPAPRRSQSHAEQLSTGQHSDRTSPPRTPACRSSGDGTDRQGRPPPADSRCPPEPLLPSPSQLPPLRSSRLSTPLPPIQQLPYRVVPQHLTNRILQHVLRLLQQDIHRGETSIRQPRPGLHKVLVRRQR